jgi:hypothetical protein
MTWRVTWNEDKRQQNIAKHGIDFEGLFDVFDGRGALVVEDQRKEYGEIRYNMLVETSDNILHITFTLRAGAYHLISARRASRKERKAYDA